MSRSWLFGVVAVLSSLSATPVLAQAVIQEPGYCAFFYPNANCQNKGPGNPYGNYEQPPPPKGMIGRAVKPIGIEANARPPIRFSPWRSRAVALNPGRPALSEAARSGGYAAPPPSIRRRLR